MAVHLIYRLANAFHFKVLEGKRTLGLLEDCAGAADSGVMTGVADGVDILDMEQLAIL